MYIMFKESRFLSPVTKFTVQQPKQILFPFASLSCINPAIENDVNGLYGDNLLLMLEQENS